MWGLLGTTPSSCRTHKLHFISSRSVDKAIRPYGLQRMWLLLGVEDTVDATQQRTKRQKNEEHNKNNRFVRRCSIVKPRMYIYLANQAQGHTFGTSAL